MTTHHLEVVQLLLNLLSKQRSQTVARRDVSPSIIFSTGPGIVELYPWAEDKALGHHRVRGDRGTLAFADESTVRQVVINTSNLDRVGTFPGPGLVLRSAGGTRVRGLGALIDGGDRRLGVGF